MNVTYEVYDPIVTSSLVMDNYKFFYYEKLYYKFYKYEINMYPYTYNPGVSKNISHKEDIQNGIVQIDTSLKALSVSHGIIISVFKLDFAF